MRRTYRLATASVLSVLLAGVAHAEDKPSFDRSFALPRAPQARLKTARAGQVASVDPRSGGPTFVWGRLEAPPAATIQSPADAARSHVRAYADVYGLTDRALATVRVAEVHDTGRGGVLVRLEQVIAGIPVIASAAKVMMRRDLSLVAIGGSLRPDAIPEAAKRATFSLPPAGAIARALSDLYDVSVPSTVLDAGSTQDQLGYVHFDLVPNGPLRFERPARVRKVFFPLGAVLVPAYFLEVFSSAGAAGWDAYAYVIDAATGDVLQRRNLTAHAEFSYRVFADAAGDLRPLDGPVADFTPHPTGSPDQSYPAFVAPSLVAIDGFNVHADPWLAAGATEALGNNVDAYTDHDGSNSPVGDTRASVTSPGVFDHLYDPTTSPSASVEQQMAGITQIFYTTNWLHDYWYDSGFDEVAGNAQHDNYGRGGAAGDRLRCETQDDLDDGAANNANMATPGDGASPRMQIYLWSGADTRSLDVSAIAQPLQTGTAGFGPASFDLTAAVVIADDGTGTPNDACEPITNNVSGQIVLIDRGSCSFQSKAVKAQAAGAAGVLIANNQGGPPPDMPPAGGEPAVTIPVLSVTQADGNTIEAALGSGPVSATMQREVGAPADAAVDNLVVAHEWGHYLHHRLVDCGLNQCGGESEGWGDFLALTLALRESDDLAGVFSTAVYAKISDPDAAYFGTRRYPYSTDLAKSPLTFKHIQVSEPLPGGPPMSPGVPFNAEVHNAGEIFSSMLFEAYAGILAQSKQPSPPYTFDEARRRMADYVVAGMKLAPTEPTYTEQRDALIAAAYAADPADALLVAQGFAKRGAGSCAVSPPRDSFDNEGVVESFEVAPAVSVTAVAIDDGVASCDNDGIVDVGETGRVVVTLANHGYLEASTTTVTLSTPSEGVTFPSGATVDVPVLAGFAEVEVPFEIAVSGAAAPTIVTIVATAENAGSCTPSVVAETLVRMHYDDVPAASKSDDFESALDTWSLAGDASELVWTKDVEPDGNHLWHGVDYASLSDTALVSPAVTASATEPLVLSFVHRYKFEASDNGGTFVTWDGSVIEYSTDGGGDWEDVSVLVDPGYTGTIANLADNPLSDREGYVGESDGYPAMAPVTLDFGTALAGQSVMFRFRIGSDQAASDVGWEIDDVAFSGIDNTPFPRVDPNADGCGADTDLPPIADAGPDQYVSPGETVVLDGSGSRDANGDQLGFAWASAGGPAVPLTLSGAQASFVAPELEEVTEVVFQLTVTSNGASATDTVKVTILADDTEALYPAGGCNCRAAGSERSESAAGWAAAALGLAAGLRRRRRRC